MKQYIMDACGGTYVGLVRELNEDNIYVEGSFRKGKDDQNILIRGSREEMPFTYAVFDGVGGTECGEKASLLAAARLGEYDKKGLSSGFKEICLDIHSRLRKLAELEDINESGTTIAALTVENGQATSVNVGDSRIYLIRNGTISRLSHDDTHRQAMIDCGLLNESSDNSAGIRHVITQYAGIKLSEQIKISPHIKAFSVADGDIFILCSDGLTDVMKDEEIRDLICDHTEESAEKLTLMTIREALVRKSADNISVIIVKVSII